MPPWFEAREHSAGWKHRASPQDMRRRLFKGTTTKAHFVLLHYSVLTCTVPDDYCYGLRMDHAQHNVVTYQAAVV